MHKTWVHVDIMNIRALLKTHLLSLPPTVKILYIVTLLYSATGIIVLFAMPVFKPWGAYNFANDFLSYFLGSKLFWAQKNLYDITNIIALKNELQLEFLVGQGFIYPPFLAFVFYPLIMLPILSAIRFWFIFNVFLYAAAGLFLGHRLRALPPVQFGACMVLYFSFPPMIGNLENGQMNIVIFSSVILFLLFLEKRKTFWSGWFLSLGTFLKVYPAALLLNEAIQKRWKTIAGFIAGAIVFGGLPLFKFPLLSYPQYIKGTLSAIQSNADPYYTNQSINAFFSRIFYSSDYGAPLLSVSPEQFGWIVRFGIVAVLLLLVWLAIKLRNKQFYLLELIWLIGIILISGKSNFWTFTPTVLCTLFLLSNWTILFKWQKIGTVIALFCFYFQGLIFYGLQLVLPEGAVFGKWGALLLSSGFFAMVAEFIILTALYARKNAPVFTTPFRL